MSTKAPYRSRETTLPVVRTPGRSLCHSKASGRIIVKSRRPSVSSRRSTHTSTSCPTWTTSSTRLTRPCFNREICTSPSVPTPTSTTAPESSRRVTRPVSGMPGLRSFKEVGVGGGVSTRLASSLGLGIGSGFYHADRWSVGGGAAGDQVPGADARQAVAGIQQRADADPLDSAVDGVVVDRVVEEERRHLVAKAVLETAIVVGALGDIGRGARPLQPDARVAIVEAGVVLPAFDLGVVPERIGI